MTVNDLVKSLDFEVVAGKENLENNIESGYTGDLLSVVMGKAKKNCVWITIQSHINIIAVATLVEVACIIVAEGFKVEEDTINKANEEGIPILISKESSFEVAKKLFKLGL